VREPYELENSNWESSGPYTEAAVMGTVIAFEGPDKFGKTVLSETLAIESGFEYLKFPNEKIESGILIRRMLNRLDPFDPALLQVLQNKNKLETLYNLKDKNYIFDRYKLSEIVYGLANGLSPEYVMDLADLLPNPDITILVTGRPYGQDDDVYSNPAFQKRVKQLYKEEGKNAGGRVIWICNLHTIDEVFSEIVRKLEGVI
jgi:thymidylate kinase